QGFRGVSPRELDELCMPRLELPPVRSYQALCAEARLSRAAGVVLGAAVGDALGHPTEFLSLAAIRERFGPAGVRGYELYWERDGQRFAPYTDDTQMAELVLRSCIWQAQTGASLDETMRVLAAGFVR